MHQKVGAERGHVSAVHLGRRIGPWTAWITRYLVFFAKRTLNSVEINPQSLRASPAAVKLEEGATTAIAGRRGCQIRLPPPRAELEATKSGQPCRLPGAEL